MAPIDSAHGGTVVGLSEPVARVVADGKVLASVQGPPRLDRRNEPQPDLMLLRPRPDRYRNSHPAAADVLLLVEIADPVAPLGQRPRARILRAPRCAGGVDRRSRQTRGRAVPETGAGAGVGA